MADYLLNDRYAESYILKLHVGYKAKVQKKFEDIFYLDCYGRFKIK